jgi:hypothetical protein
MGDLDGLDGLDGLNFQSMGYPSAGAGQEGEDMLPCFEDLTPFEVE